MERKKISLEMECVHDECQKEMRLEWLGGRVRLVLSWLADCGVVMVDGDVRIRFSLEGMSVDELLSLEERVGRDAERLSVFGTVE